MSKIKKSKVKERETPVESIRTKLLQKKQALIIETTKEFSKHVNGEFRELAEAAEEDGNGGVRDISEDISISMLGKNRRLLNSINDALKKIASGTYGICEECEDLINENRLLANPAAILCISCQEEKEKEEAREKAFEL